MFFIFSVKKFWPYSRTVKISNLKGKKQSLIIAVTYTPEKTPVCFLSSCVCNMEETKSAFARLKLLKMLI